MSSLENKISRAKNYAYRLLSYRARSCREIEERLRSRGFSRIIIEKVVDYLRELNYLNDGEFAREWANGIMKTKPAGAAMLKHRLRRKGVDGDVVENVVSEIMSRYPEEETAGIVVEKLIGKYHGLNSLKRKKRIYDYLRRRGFRPEIVYEAIKEL